MKLEEMIVKMSSMMSITGHEDHESEALCAWLSPYFDGYDKDAMKNQIFVRYCGKPNAPKILIDAHFDEIGMMVSEVKEGGFLTVVNIGGVDTRILQAADVLIYGKETLHGIVASTPPHLSSPDDRGKLKKITELLIDTGYSREELEEIAPIGTPVGFFPKYQHLLGERITGKGFDDKACAACVASALMNVPKEDLAGDVYFLLSAHEETDRLGGVVCGGYSIMPDYAMVVDVNLGKTPDTPAADTVELGKGPSVTLSAVTDRRLTAMTLALAEEKEIKVQKSVSATSTGTNATSLGLVRGGISVVDVGLPLRSMHTYNEMLDLDDARALERLVTEFVCSKEIAEVFGNDEYNRAFEGALSRLRPLGLRGQRGRADHEKGRALRLCAYP